MRNLHNNDDDFKLDEIVLVFDHEAWSKNGGDDVKSNNRIFYKKARIIMIRETGRPVPELVVDIEWLHSGKTSHGHFLYGIERIKQL